MRASRLAKANTPGAGSGLSAPHPMSIWFCNARCCNTDFTRRSASGGSQELAVDCVAGMPTRKRFGPPPDLATAARAAAPDAGGAVTVDTTMHAIANALTPPRRERLNTFSPIRNDPVGKGFNQVRLLGRLHEERDRRPIVERRAAQLRDVGPAVRGASSRRTETRLAEHAHELLRRVAVHMRSIRGTVGDAGHAPIDEVLERER